MEQSGLIRFSSRNRSQLVEINQHIFSSLDVKIDVPGGSTLGSLLFLLFIKELNKSFDFAVDITLYLDNNSSTNKIILVHSKLAQIQTWKSAKKLTLNVHNQTT